MKRAIDKVELKKNPVTELKKKQADLNAKYKQIFKEKLEITPEEVI